MVARSGGRQGCKLGAILFNLIYAVALARVRESIGKKHGVLEIHGLCSSSLWSNNSVCACPESKVHDQTKQQRHLAVDATFVDDEAIMLASRSPRRLEFAIVSLLKNLCEIFSSLGLVLNFALGKSEAFLVLRGKNAAKFNRKYYVDQRSTIPLPSTSNAKSLHIVQQYKHLGSIICFGRCL